MARLRRLVLSLLTVFSAAAASADPPAENVHIVTYESYARNWSIHLGGGNTWVVGGLHGQVTSGPNFAIGGGYDFTRHLGLRLEFLQHELGIDDSVLRVLGVQDGRARVWSLTLNPVYKFGIYRRFKGYVTAGGGFYRRTLEFSTIVGTALVPVFDPFFGFEGNALVPIEQETGSFHSSAGGLNGGFGLTFEISRNIGFFAEARYHHAFTHPSDTQLLPMTIGFRF
jgi:opacity protein-like surface antigen